MNAGTQLPPPPLRKHAAVLLIVLNALDKTVLENEPVVRPMQRAKPSAPKNVLDSPGYGDIKLPRVSLDLLQPRGLYYRVVPVKMSLLYVIKPMQTAPPPSLPLPPSLVRLVCMIEDFLKLWWRRVRVDTKLTAVCVRQKNLARRLFG